MGQSQENGFIGGRTELNSWEPAAEPGVKKSFSLRFGTKRLLQKQFIAPGRSGTISVFI